MRSQSRCQNDTFLKMCKRKLFMANCISFHYAMEWILIQVNLAISTFYLSQSNSALINMKSVHRQFNKVSFFTWQMPPHLHQHPAEIYVEMKITATTLVLFVYLIYFYCVYRKCAWTLVVQSIEEYMKIGIYCMRRWASWLYAMLCAWMHAVVENLCCT